MKHHISTAAVLSMAEDMGVTVAEIPEGMDPVGALVVVVQPEGVRSVEVGTITAEDIKGTGPFIIFNSCGSLLGAGFTSRTAIRAIQAAWDEEMAERMLWEAEKIAASVPPNPA